MHPFRVAGVPSCRNLVRSHSFANQIHNLAVFCCGQIGTLLNQKIQVQILHSLIWECSTCQSWWTRQDNDFIRPVRGGGDTITGWSESHWLQVLPLNCNCCTKLDGICCDLFSIATIGKWLMEKFVCLLPHTFMLCQNTATHYTWHCSIVMKSTVQSKCWGSTKFRFPGQLFE